MLPEATGKGIPGTPRCEHTLARRAVRAPQVGGYTGRATGHRECGDTRRQRAAQDAGGGGCAGWGERGHSALSTEGPSAGTHPRRTAPPLAYVCANVGERGAARLSRPLRPGDLWLKGKLIRGGFLLVKWTAHRVDRVSPVDLTVAPDGRPWLLKTLLASKQKSLPREIIICQLSVRDRGLLPSAEVASGV